VEEKNGTKVLRYFVYEWLDNPTVVAPMNEPNRAGFSAPGNFFRSRFKLTEKRRTDGGSSRGCGAADSVRAWSDIARYPGDDTPGIETDIRIPECVCTVPFDRAEHQEVIDRGRM
jgi:hypothetical protein